MACFGGCKTPGKPTFVSAASDPAQMIAHTGSRCFPLVQTTGERLTNFLKYVEFHFMDFVMLRPEQNSF